MYISKNAPTGGKAKAYRCPMCQDNGTKFINALRMSLAFVKTHIESDSFSEDDEDYALGVQLLDKIEEVLGELQ